MIWSGDAKGSYLAEAEMKSTRKVEFWNPDNHKFQT